MMRRLLTHTILLTLLTAATGSKAHAQASQQQPPPPPAAVSDASPFGQSRIEGGNYSNDYFGISFALPKGWLVLNADDNKKIFDVGKELVEEGASERKKAIVEASLVRVGFLVNTSKYQLGTSRPEFNALFMCIAERVPTAVIKDGADYLIQMQRAVQGPSAKIEFTSPMRTVQVGGVAFTTADAKTTAGPVTSVQRYYVSIRKGYALLMAYTYFDEADLKTFDELLASVKFK